MSPVEQPIIIPNGNITACIFKIGIYGISQVVHLGYPRPKKLSVGCLRFETSALPEDPYTVYCVFGLHFLAPNNRRLLCCVNVEVSEASRPRSTKVSLKANSSSWIILDKNICVTFCSSRSTRRSGGWYSRPTDININNAYPRQNALFFLGPQTTFLAIPVDCYWLFHSRGRVLFVV